MKVFFFCFFFIFPLILDCQENALRGFKSRILHRMFQFTVIWLGSYVWFVGPDKFCQEFLWRLCGWAALPRIFHKFNHYITKSFELLNENQTFHLVSIFLILMIMFFITITFFIISSHDSFLLLLHPAVFIISGLPGSADHKSETFLPVSELRNGSQR